jgi:cyclohexanone monooxygenase
MEDNRVGAAREIDKQALRRKYREERDKRLRPEGEAQYVRMTERIADEDFDPFMSVQPRAPLTDHVTVSVIGGGFAGLLTGARLREAGIGDFRIIDKAGDCGGVWYWNRYPGIMCDTASMVYMPLLEETGHRPTEKYAQGPEILEHCRRIGRHFKLYDKALLHTRVTELEWDSGAKVWQVRTNRGDHFTSQFVVMGPGPLTVPKLPDIPGIESFRGRTFHSGRWDYDYTGGVPCGSAYRSGVGDGSVANTGSPLSRLGDKRVAVIGTGATGI